MTDPLPSWNGTAKTTVTTFVERVTPQGADFVPVEQRIAVFDNDGTLWTEQPIYVQVAFAIDWVKALAPQHLEWKDRQPFKSVLDDDPKELGAQGEHGLIEIIGDQQMLEWTAAGKGPRLMVLIHHTDAEREYAYDRKSRVVRRGWLVVDMKNDWSVIYPFEKTLTLHAESR